MAALPIGSQLGGVALLPPKSISAARSTLFPEKSSVRLAAAIQANSSAVWIVYVCPLKSGICEPPLHGVKLCAKI